jgi:beta-barrel assembly-enhancing protease
MASAIFFDGQTAADHHVTVAMQQRGLVFKGDGVVQQFWPYGALAAVERRAEGAPLRVASSVVPGARLVIHDRGFSEALLAEAPQLEGRATLRGHKRAAIWTAAGIAAFAVVAYAVVQYAPAHLAFLLPDDWRNAVGQQTEISLTNGASACDGAAGVSALGVIAARLAEADPDMPPLRITVYDIPVMNAFAMPGERIVITRELIKRAGRAEQVAGVLAHEIGHVVKRHPEAGVLRATGLQMLISAMTGGSNSTIGTAAGLAAVLRYSRQAETEADGIAVGLMTRSAIDTLALKEFFQILLAEEGQPSGGAWGGIGSSLSTHPGTQDRIDAIPALPEGVTAAPVLTNAQWQALKDICK